MASNLGVFKAMKSCLSFLNLDRCLFLNLIRFAAIRAIFENSLLPTSFSRLLTFTRVMAK